MLTQLAKDLGSATQREAKEEMAGSNLIKNLPECPDSLRIKVERQLAQLTEIFGPPSK